MWYLCKNFPTTPRKREREIERERERERERDRRESEWEKMQLSWWRWRKKQNPVCRFLFYTISFVDAVVERGDALRKTSPRENIVWDFMRDARISYRKSLWRLFDTSYRTSILLFFCTKYFNFLIIAQRFEIVNVSRISWKGNNFGSEVIARDKLRII